MANFHKYDTLAEYNAATDRPTDESNVSLAGNAILTDGENVVVEYKACYMVAGDAVAYDTTLNKFVGIKGTTLNTATLDQSRYIIIGYYHGVVNGRGQVLSKTTPSTSIQWGVPQYYKLEIATSAAGSFHWAITVNGTAKSGTVSWSAGATLASIASQINSVQNMATAKDGYIAIAISTYSNTTLTLTSNTGATLTDMSRYCKVGDVVQEEKHRGFQSLTVASMFPDLGWEGATATAIMRNGGNGSYRCGANLAKYMSHWSTNGASEYKSELGTDIINKATFEGFATAEGDAKALYDKYNGSWEAYMRNRMADSENMNANAACMKYYDKGLEMTAKLASITTQNADGDWVSAYPAAAKAFEYAVAGVEKAAAGCWHLPTARDIVSFMEDSTFAAINAAARKSGGTVLGSSNYYWSVSEYGTCSAWLYGGYGGALSNFYKGDSIQCRPSLALDFED